MFSGAIRLTDSSMAIIAGERKTPNSSSAASAVSDRASSADGPPRRRAGLSNAEISLHRVPQWIRHSHESFGVTSRS